MKRIRTLIVDDEDLAREGIALRLAPETDFQIVGQARDGSEALDCLRRLQPDLLFLDIQMPIMDGFELVRAVGAEAMPTTVFVTAFDEHAVTAFEAQALDYLLKPIDPERFQLTLQRVRRKLRDRSALEAAASLRAWLSQAEAETAGTQPEPTSRPRGAPFVKRLTVRSRGRTRIVPVGEIDWIEADDDYVRLHCGGSQWLLRESLRSLERRLDPGRFLRVHKGAIVCLDRVREARPTASGDYQLFLHDGTIVRMSRSFRQAFEEAISGA